MGLPMLERHSTALRVISVVAGTVISLACGTNYAYSAWAPQFSRRLVFNSTQSNLIGTAANFGMYLCGVPIGMLIDAKGPRTGALLGAALLGVGYAGLYLAYVRGPGSIHIAVLCFFAALTGVGGASAFFGSIKTATVNWPTHRGTATAFPIAAFGLSAFLFSLIGGLAFHGDAAGLLLLFAIGTTLMILLSTYFLQIVPLAPQYAEVPTDPEPDVEERDGGRLHGLSDVYHGPLSERTTYTLRSPGHPTEEPRSSSQARLLRKSPDLVPLGHTDDDEFDDASERKSLSKGNSVYGEVHGIRMLKHSEFYEFWILLGSMTGIGLMTINNIGNDAQALWSAWDKTTTDDWIEKQQKAYVSIISFTSFIGRLSSGIGSDFIAMKLHKSRFWCLFASSLVFCLAQVVAILAENPNLLALLSGCNGLAYGILFGVMPVLVAETFGSSGISQNWGFMTLSPIIFGNIFNIFYGRVYDEHSRTAKTGHLECLVGRFCYKDAYWLTFAVSVVAMLMILWCIRHRQIAQRKAARRRRVSDEHIE